MTATMTATTQEVNQFLQYCKSCNLQLSTPKPKPFNALPMCIISTIYSLRANYNTVTVSVETRYANMYMSGNRYNSGETVEDLIKHIDACGGPEMFATNVLNNKQVLAGRLKAEVCKEIAEKLNSLGIKTISDFISVQGNSVKNIEDALYSIKGVGEAAVNYLFMTAGDQNRCKADVWIRRFTKNALGNGYDKQADEFYQDLFSKAVAVLKNNYPDMTVAFFDFLIWESFH